MNEYAVFLTALDCHCVRAVSVLDIYVLFCYVLLMGLIHSIKTDKNEVRISHKNVTFLFSATNLIENTQRCYAIYSTLLPICAVAMAVKAMCTYCDTVLGCNLNSYSQLFF
jgi:hypothetical protein